MIGHDGDVGFTICEPGDPPEPEQSLFDRDELTLAAKSRTAAPEA